MIILKKEHMAYIFRKRKGTMIMMKLLKRQRSIPLVEKGKMCN